MKQKQIKKPATGQPSQQKKLKTEKLDLDFEGEDSKAAEILKAVKKQVPKPKGHYERDCCGVRRWVPDE